MSGAKPSDSKACKSMHFFPKDYNPRTDDVIIGRGKKPYDHSGNQKLRRTVASKLVEYSAAKSQKDKSAIISSILAHFRDGNTNFVKLDPQSKKWFDVGDYSAREKISQMFRDALCEKYTSSSGYKNRRKREKKLLRVLSREREQSGLEESYDRQEGLDNGRNRRSSQLNVESQPLPTGSSNFIAAYMSFLPSNMLECEDPFEPTPICEPQLEMSMSQSWSVLDLGSTSSEPISVAERRSFSLPSAWLQEDVMSQITSDSQAKTMEESICTSASNFMTSHQQDWNNSVMYYEVTPSYAKSSETESSEASRLPSSPQPCAARMA